MALHSQWANEAIVLVLAERRLDYLCWHLGRFCQPLVRPAPVDCGCSERIEYIASRQAERSLLEARMICQECEHEECVDRMSAHGVDGEDEGQHRVSIAYVSERFCPGEFQ